MYNCKSFSHPKSNIITNLGLGNEQIVSKNVHLSNRYCYDYMNTVCTLGLGNEHAYDLYNNNRITVLVAGYEASAMLDSGATISVIDAKFVENLSKIIQLQWDHSSHKDCTLANGACISLDNRIALPIKFNNITIEAELYSLPMNNIQVIIGCDLLSLLKAKLDFQTKQLIIPLPNAHPTLANL